MTKLRKNHRFLSVGGHIKQICKPLQYLQTHLFTYMKNFHDGTQINISSDPQWVDDYYSLRLHESSYFEGRPEQYASGFKWWHGGSDLPVFTHGRDYYNSHYGITLCQQVEDGCEFFFFSSGKENASMLDGYINNLDLLERFAVYFKEQAQSILRKCGKQRIVRQGNDKHIISEAEGVRRDMLLASVGVDFKDVSLLLQRFTPLTPRENECLDYLLKESTTSNIAAAMNISIRTAETHIERIKNKLHCRTKNELIIKLLSSEQL